MQRMFQSYKHINVSESNRKCFLHYRLKEQASTDKQELWREVGQTRRNEQRDLTRKRS